jgi:hypothetical protein
MLAGRNPPAGPVVSTLAIRDQDQREGFVCCVVRSQTKWAVVGGRGRFNTCEVGTLKGILDLRHPVSADAGRPRDGCGGF